LFVGSPDAALFEEWPFFRQLSQRLIGGDESKRLGVVVVDAKRFVRPSES
jgi:hypothetical protein